MPEETSQSYGNNPFSVPDPYYLPGYTGHCPRYNSVIGQTYGRATHILLKEEPSAPGRLKPLLKEGLGCYQQLEQPLQQEEVDLLEERGLSQGRAVLTKDIAPGYKGHVPRASQMIGLNFNQSCIRGMAEFEKRRRKLKELLEAKTVV